MSAYHAVESAADVDLILADGFLLPTIYWIKPEEARSLCRESVSAYRDINLDVQRSAARGVYGLAQQRAEEISRRQRRERIKPPGLRRNLEEEPSIECEDILAGELDLVFLSVGRWYLDEKQPSGFEFDAEELIERGAHIRLKDFIYPYMEALKTIVVSDATPGEARHALERAFTTIQRTGELYGQDAVRALDDHKNLRGWDPPELVYPAPLPVEWAIRVWRSGKATHQR